jgi:hypothetical protein
MTLRGAEVRPVTNDRVDIVGLDVTVFSGGPEAKVDTVILSPEASFLDQREDRPRRPVGPADPRRRGRDGRRLDLLLQREKSSHRGTMPM